MRLDGNRVLITGGASGIGLGLAERFLAAGSRVLLCGRRAERLTDVARKHPGLVATRACDLSKSTERVAAAEWATREFPDVNVLVNNAGVQVRLPLEDASGWDRFHEEIEINFAAAVHLTLLLVPHLKTRPAAAIVNVTSGLAFAPLALAPVYSATKAALHSFTLSLRHHLTSSPVQVVEIAPPAVDTDLGGAGLHTFGVSVDELLEAVMPRLEAGDAEITYGFSRQSSRASRAELDEIFRRMNAGPAH